MYLSFTRPTVSVCHNLSIESHLKANWSDLYVCTRLSVRPVYLCLCLSLYPSACTCLPDLPVSLHTCLTLHLSIFTCLSPCSPSNCLSLSISLCTSLLIHPSLFPTHLCLYPSECLPVCLTVRLSSGHPSVLTNCVTLLSTRHPTCLRACLPGHLPNLCLSSHHLCKSVCVCMCACVCVWPSN